MSPSSTSSSNSSSAYRLSFRPIKTPVDGNPLHCLQCKLVGLSCSLTSRYSSAPRGGPCSRCIRKCEPLCMREALFGDYVYQPVDSRVADTEAFRRRREELLAAREDRLDKDNWVLPAWDKKAAARATLEAMRMEDS